MEPKRARSGVKSFRSPRPDATRLLAFEVFTEVNRRGAYANLILPRALSESALETRDRAFATELVYGALRMQGRHDWILSQVSDRPWESVDPAIVDVARLGVHQLFEMRVPDHAAVAATVELARKVLGESRASYVNALLRKVSSRSLSEWLQPLEMIDDDVTRYAIQYSHPEWIVSAYFDLLREKSEVIAALSANNVPASPTLVAWPGRSTQADLLELGGVATKYSPYGATSVGIPGDIDLIRSRRAGVQDEGSQIVAATFAAAAIQKSDWLDLCAGPGGKAALLSSIASQAGIGFVANEISPARAKLVEQVVAGAQVWVGDGRDVAQRRELFGAVIADVPCTGIGALRRRSEVRWRRKPSDLAPLTQLQRELFDSAVSVTEVGGVIAYVTCSPHLAETRVQVSDALKRHGGIRQISVEKYLPATLSDALVNGAMQLWTHRHGTDAMFLALFERLS
ncbi:MAG: transcription antitermination factor NusB [Actinomycetota bacterium]